MGNLTSDRRVARRLSAAEPMPGHDLVVFDRVGDSGKRYRETIPPGGTFWRPWLERLRKGDDQYIAVAVSRDSSLHHSFTCQCESRDQLGPLTVEVSLEFCARDARMVAEGLLNEDPLVRLQSHIEELVERTVRRFDWMELVEGRVVLEEEFGQSKSLDENGASRPHPDLARQFAKGLGLEIRTLRFRALLPDEIPQERKKIVDLEMHHPMHIREIELGESLKKEQAKFEAEVAELQDQLQKKSEERGLDLDYLQEQRTTLREHASLMRKVTDRAVQALGTAMDKAAGNVETTADLSRSIKELLALQREVRQLTAAPGADASVSHSVTGAQKYLEESSSQDPLADRIHRLMRLSEEMPFDAKVDRRRLQSAALHVLAEAALGTEADRELVDGYRVRLEKEHLAATEAGAVESNEQREFLRELRDIENLKQALA